MGVHVFPILNLPPTSPPHPIPQGHPSAPALSTLSHALNLDWQSILHMVIYVFQCYSIISSHPCLLPHSPKVCSLHLSLLLSLHRPFFQPSHLALYALTTFNCWQLYKLIMHFITVHLNISLILDPQCHIQCT